MHRAGQLALVAVCALFVFRVITQWSNSGIGLLADALIVALAVTGVNLITGYTGQLSIGHAAFFAIGGYVSMMLVGGTVSTPFFGDDNVWSPGWTIPVAALLCFIVGAMVGLPALRLKGIYLALVTLVFVEAVREVFRFKEWAGVTGGASGLKSGKYLPPAWTPFEGRRDVNEWIMWLALALFLLCTALVTGLLHSRIGRAMVAVRDNETAAAVMGVDLSRIKTVVFGLSGAITGIAGALFGLKLGLVDPDIRFFGILGAITFLVAMFVGGAAQVWGPLVGAMFYVFVDDFARGVGESPGDSLLLGWLVGEDTKLDGLGGAVFGVLLILFARFAPLGAIGTTKTLRSRVVQVVPKPPEEQATSEPV
jgi:branched-chain amino acid transport system permease protein